MGVYDYTVNDIKGDQVSLSAYQGKLLLIVNTASKCGFTPQYDGLEKLYRKYKDRGFVILGFPSNQFLAQERRDFLVLQASLRSHFSALFENRCPWGKRPSAFSVPCQIGSVSRL